jgi:hypothetical protein
MHVVYETFPRLNLKFSVYFAHFFVYRFECVSEFFFISTEISLEMVQAHQHIQTYTQK